MQASITTRPSSLMPTDAYWEPYRKMHIPDDPLYYEKYYFTPGDQGYRASTLVTDVLACWFAGTSGIPKEPG